MPLTKHLTLRAAGATDWPAVQALLQAHGLPVAGAREHLATFLLAMSGGELVGCAGAEVHGRQGDLALLRSVAVAPGLQGQGIGRALLQRLLLEAPRRGIRRLALLTTSAADWFTRFGFERVDEGEAPALRRALAASAELQGACPASATLMALTLPAAPAAGPSPHHDLPVAVIGAGPVGLAAAARLIERGITPLVLEAGERVGAHLLDYGHVRLFSPWRWNIDAAMAAQLAASGWTAPPADELPLAREVVERVLEPYAALPAVQRVLHLDTRVTAIGREGLDKLKSAGREAAPFVIRALRDGVPLSLRARAVIDASGTWSTPNPLGADGLPAPGERDHADAIAHGIPDVLGRDRHAYAGRHTLVVGAGHSAANALLALAELAEAVPGTRLSWAVRSPSLARVFGGGDADALPARGALGSALRALRDGGRLAFVPGLRIAQVVREGGGRLTVRGHDLQGRPLQVAGVDRIVCATGQRPDLAMLGELRLKLDPALESTEALGPLIDPNVHSCGTVRPHGHRELAHPEPGFYTLGVKSYGRAPTFLMATGFEQARSVAAAIAGDLAAADRVELDLPATGVCSVGGGSEADADAAACCGAPAPAEPAVTTPAAAPAAVPAAKPRVRIPVQAAGGCCG